MNLLSHKFEQAKHNIVMWPRDNRSLYSSKLPAKLSLFLNVSTLHVRRRPTFIFTHFL